MKRALVCLLFLGCDPGISPARPDASDPLGFHLEAPLANIRFAHGCPQLTQPLAEPGDPIDGDTYETFASGVFTAFCTRCHSSELVGQTARNGAPADFNWDDPAIVRDHLPEIRRMVGVRNIMPPFDPKPGCWTRRRLVRWIDAGAP